MVDVAKGLDYIHSHGVIHGDLKGVSPYERLSVVSLISVTQPNILVDVSGHARITDFALVQGGFDIVSIPDRRSVQWTAPEVLEETGTPSPETDIFSFGMVMVEVRYDSTTVLSSQVDSLLASLWRKAFTGMAPFSDNNSLAAMIAIISGERPPRPTHPTFTATLWEVMNRCWDQDRHGRPRMPEVLLALNPIVHERMRTNGSPPFTADVLTLVSDIQKRLENLDILNEHRPLLYALLSHRDLEPHINSLIGDNLRRFVELFDRVSK